MRVSYVSSIAEELSIPKSYIREVDKAENRVLIAVHRKWLRELTKTGTLCEFIPHEKFTAGEVCARLKVFEVLDSSWTQVFLTTIPKSEHRVIPLPRQITQPQTIDDDLTYSQMLQYICLTNYKNLWKDGFKKYNAMFAPYGDGSRDSSQFSNIHLVPYDTVVRDIITRFYGCPITRLHHNSVSVSVNAGSYDPHANLLPASIALETSSFFYILHEVTKVHTLQDCLNYSPAMLGENYFKPMFLVYQLLRLMRDTHDRGLALGDISLTDILISNDLWIQVIPRITDNIYEVPKPEKMSRHSASKRLHSGSSDDSFNEKYEVTDLGHYCELWVRGCITNFEYLTILNNLSGRKFGDPRRHHVFPWVTDFSSKTGANWRDLTKSKFRLNKGDTQLDLTYDADNTASPHVPHHVSDVLSEITYYVYLARVTPKAVLCKYVRTQWVPAEYPASIQRLQQWTPDECIPEFFTDESIFRSIHNDLPDLEVPPWANSAQEFITCHRNALESSYVSERLHHWIDLTFGYKLSGHAAVKAKNVCLQLVDNHTNLTSSGIVQLFDKPHPQKLMPSPYWSKVPPRVLKLKLDVDDEEDQSSETEEHDQPTAAPSSITVSKLLNRSRTSLNQLDSSANLEGGSLYLPHNYNPVNALVALESLHNFVSNACNKPNVGLQNPRCEQDKDTATAYKQVVAIRRAQEMLVLGCAIAELFYHPQLRPMGSNLAALSLKKRLENCRSVVSVKRDNIPKCIEAVVTLLLQTDAVSSAQLNPGIRSYPITNIGIPPPSAHQLLLPSLSSSLLPFPTSFPVLYATLKTYHEFVSMEVELRSALYAAQVDKTATALLIKRVTEYKIVELAKQLQTLMDVKGGGILMDNRWLNPILPLVIEMLEDKDSAALAAWHLLELIARVLGPQKSVLLLLQPAIKLYENVDDDGVSLQLEDGSNINKIRIYHKNFLLKLILRFGLRVFLENFISLIAEAVAGYQDGNTENKVVSSCRNLKPKVSSEISHIFSMEDTKLSNHESSTALYDEPTEYDSNTLPLKDDDNDVQEELDDNMASLREVLSDEADAQEEEGEQDPYVCNNGDQSNVGLNNAKNVSNYWDQQQQSVMLPDKSSFTGSCKVSDVSNSSIMWLAHRLGPVLTARYVTRSLLRVLVACYTEDIYADERAVNVVNCLMGIAGIYGEQLVVLHYIPHMAELVASCKKSRMTLALEGGIIAYMTLLRYVISFLTDLCLSNIMQDTLCKLILHPTIRILSSPKVLFPGGVPARSLLASKIVDNLYALGMRQGHLISRSLQRFFLCFDRLRQSDISKRDGSARHAMKVEKGTHSDSGESPPPQSQTQQEKLSLRTKIMEELCMVLTPELAFDAYSLFAQHFGESFMHRSLVNMNFIEELCALYKEERQLSGQPQKDIKNISRGLEEYGGSHATISGNKIHLRNIGGFEDCKEVQDTSRYLRGNWLSYWEYEAGCSGADSRFNFKQIKLQTFSGHTNTVKTLYVLDNENSFVSGSRDKTVKLWSLSSQGNGSNISQCQYTYSNHRKSILSLGFCERSRLISSCDSVLHLWDPFVGRLVSIVRNIPPISVLRPLPAPHSTILAANTYSCLNVLDTRTATLVADLKICANVSGLIRCITISPDSSWAAVGQSTGVITVLDLRTGSIISSWKGHEGEVLQLITYDKNTLISSSLDQSVSVWNVSDSRLNFYLRGPSEPVHCLSLYYNELISGTTANRIGTHAKISSEASFSSTKLRSDTFKGVLSTMTILPLNRTLLLGADTGLITLVS